VLFRLPGLPALVQQTYAAAEFAEVHELPWSHETPATAFLPAAGFARAIDIRDFAFDPAFRGVAMIDFFLAALGLDPAGVPAGLRRNIWLAPRLRPVPPPGLAPSYVLVCPRTSMALRDMPAEIHAAIVAWLLARGHRVVTQGQPRPGAEHAPPVGTLAELAGLAAGARLVVSADTAMPHLADAFGVPCLAFFTTHRPEWRVRDYPRCRAVHLPAAGLPPALEFSRGAGDEAAARAAWFGDGVNFSWLYDALAAALN
jgi:Glycosyltransferase family 9 (heptosyltransferase)